MAWLLHLVIGALVIMLHFFFDGGVFDHQEAPFLAVTTIWRAGRGFKDFGDQRIRHRVGLEPSHGAHGTLDIK